MIKPQTLESLNLNVQTGKHRLTPCNIQILYLSKLDIKMSELTKQNKKTEGLATKSLIVIAASRS